MSTPGNLSEQVLALPNGAGHIGSAGQTFHTDPHTGTARYTIPIETPSGHAGLKPALSLTYSTRAGNGIAGLGWSLGLARIERRTDKGLPVFSDDEDTFTLQGDELLPVGGGSYRQRIETRFARIRHVRSHGVDHWIVSERDGTRVFYGLEPDHRLHDGMGRIAAWCVSRKQDAQGNEIVYTYRRDRSSHDVQLVSVAWAGCYGVDFAYEKRADVIRSCRVGFEHRCDTRLSNISLKVRKTSDGAYHAFRVYTLDYAQSALTGRSLLIRVTTSGIHPDGTRLELPSLTLGYTEPSLAACRWHGVSGALPGGSLQDRNISLACQSGSGLPDLLETTGTGHWLRQNLGRCRFGPPRRVPSPALVNLDGPGTFMADMSGDGWADLAVAGGRRVYRGVSGGGWGSAYPSAYAPSVDLDAPDVRVADLNADGIPDALRSGAGSWVYFENLGEGKWASGVLVPNPSTSFDNRRIQLADITGDGLPDLVYTDRRQVLVWPGLGRGRFGAPYQMKNAPDLGVAFDPAAVRWADVTGSGQADLVYSRSGSVKLCLNRAGAALSEPIALSGPSQSSHGHVEPVDLLGTGATGLLFTDHQGQRGAWRFLELFPAGAPDLLTNVNNGIGSRTTIAYSSSAAHWVRDQLAGRTWSTSMPSSQLVVDSITTTDLATATTLGVRYEYHDGVYDGEEREFRGFALVDQIDRDTERDDPSPLPQVRVRRWFHTGRRVDRRDECAALPEGTLEDEVPELPWARRSLRGRLRRQETFALDGNPKPYSVTETAHRVFPVHRKPGTELYSFAPLPVRSRVTYSERTSTRRVLETATSYDLQGGGGYGLPHEQTVNAIGRRAPVTTAHERQQGMGLEFVSVIEYVHRDEPDDDPYGRQGPSYLVGYRSKVERHALVAGVRELLSRELYFYDGEAYRGLGYPGSRTEQRVEHGRLSARLVLALTDALIAANYPTGSGAPDAVAAAGHYLSLGGEHYLHAERYAYDARGMVVGARDANGNESRHVFDPFYALFPVEHTDAAGNPALATRGELPFQVTSAFDANGNTTGFTYNADGRVASCSIQGKLLDGEWQGDPPEYPTYRYEYDHASVPAKITTRSRQRRLGAMYEFIRYVDGLGRTIQERHSAEPAPDTDSARYRVSGRQVFNHKGLVVKRYQPIFSSTSAYAVAGSDGSVVDIDHDPLGRVVRLTHPDHTFESVVHDPWIQTVADRNDNAGQLAIDDPRYSSLLPRIAAHFGTATLRYLDGLGREIAIAEDNGSETHVSRLVLDLQGRILEVWDARGLDRPTWRFRYDLAGRRIYGAHAHGAGERLVLADAAGNTIWTRDTRNIETTRTFDGLNRPLQEATTDGEGTKLRRQWRYVDYDPMSGVFERQRANNAIGRLEEARDHAGLQYFEYDWRGLPTRVHCRFWDQRDGSGLGWEDESAQLWSAAAAWDPPIPAGDREAITNWLQLPNLSDPTTLTISTSYDAAGRPIGVVYPGRLQVRYEYGAGGLLDRIEADPGTGVYQPIVESPEYDARAQLTFLRFGNGVSTRKTYDEALARLLRVSTRLAAPEVRYQGLAYLHDPSGNLLEITDQLTHSQLRDPRIVPNSRSFDYDPRYRLVAASGIRHRSASDKAIDVLAPSPVPLDYERYAVQYGYDPVGNLTSNGEYSSGVLFYKTSCEDLFNGDAGEAASSSLPDAGNFRYDANGNTTGTPRHMGILYTHDNQVRHVGLGERGQVHYFRHGDQRVLRLARTTTGVSFAVYLGPFEYHVRSGADAHTKVLLQLRGHGLHAQLEGVLAGADPVSLPIIFVHPDHLGSGHVLTQGDGSLLTQEEYFPYGRASDRRDGRNRYRFIGVERDEDTGLCMTGPRTYDAVSGRFLQPDPLAPVRTRSSPYVYASGSPIGRLDPGGYSDDPSQDTPKKRPAEATMVSGGGYDSGQGLGMSTDPGAGGRLAQHDLQRRGEGRRIAALNELVAYEHVASDVGLHTKAGRALLASLPSDPGQAAAMGKIDGILTISAEQALHNVTLLGKDVHPELGESAIRIAEGELRNLENAENVARAAAGLPPRGGIQTTLQVTKARAALRGAGESFVKGIPLVGYFFVPGVLAEASQLYRQGDYVNAGLTAVSVAYEPVDWANTFWGVWDFGVESWKEYQGAKTSASIDTELRRLEAKQGD